MEDNFNLYGLRALVPHYNEALDMILDIERMEETPSDDRQVCLCLCLRLCLRLCLCHIDTKHKNKQTTGKNRVVSGIFVRADTCPVRIDICGAQCGTGEILQRGVREVPASVLQGSARAASSHLGYTA